MRRSKSNAVAVRARPLRSLITTRLLRPEHEAKTNQSRRRRPTEVKRQMIVRALNFGQSLCARVSGKLARVSKLYTDPRPESAQAKSGHPARQRAFSSSSSITLHTGVILVPPCAVASAHWRRRGERTTATTKTLYRSRAECPSRNAPGQYLLVALRQRVSHLERQSELSRPLTSESDEKRLDSIQLLKRVALLEFDVWSSVCARCQRRTRLMVLICEATPPTRQQFVSSN